MGGGVLPDGGTLQWVHFLHRVLAALVFGHVIALTLRTRRDLRKPVRMWGWTVLGLYSAQILVGAANVWTRLVPAAVLGHVIGGALTWASLVALLVVSRRAEVVRGREEAAEIPATEVPASAEVSKPSDAPSAHHASVVGRLGAYIQLTKPRIVVLLLVTTVPAMVLAAGGFPPLWLVAATLAGGILTSGSANAINQYLERDIDSKMQRTRRRPLPMHRVPPGRALVFGLLLGLIGTLWLAVVVNPLAAGLAAGAIGFYVVVYTMLLKRNTPQNIVIGGAAGAVPVLVGWAAVTGSLAAPAWIMFAIIFFWTPPHFWALAMRYREDYANAGVPMLPVVRTAAQTTAQILLYSVILVPVTLLLFPAARLGPLYLATATGLGAVFVWLAVRLWRAPTTARAMTLFKYSVNYLGILFAAIALDRLLA
jgi:protoheme IX farnesyltransferase